MRHGASAAGVGALAVAALLLGRADAVVNIQNVGSGARSVALGNSFVAVADDPSAVFENPAGVALQTRRQVAYTNVSLFYTGIEGDNLGQHVVGYVQPLGSRLGLGLGYERIGSDLMSENGAFVSLACQVSRSLSVGVNGKYLFWSVGDIPNDAVTGQADPLSNSSAGGIGVDVGMLWKVPVSGVQVGAMVKNVNRPDVASQRSGVRADGTRWQLQADDGKLPMDLAVGMSYRLRGTSLLSAQYVVRDLTGDRSDKRLLVGGETQLVQGLMVRAGGSKMFQQDASGELNAGLGYSWGKLGFDYAYHLPLDLTETNGAHRFSLAMSF